MFLFIGRIDDAESGETPAHDDSLLLESGDALLLETGDRILLEA